MSKRTPAKVQIDSCSKGWVTVMKHYGPPDVAYTRAIKAADNLNAIGHCTRVKMKGYFPVVVCADGEPEAHA